LAHFDREYALDELGESLVDNGFFTEEPLLVVKEARLGAFRVVEGNRRLAALKLLLERQSRAFLPAQRRGFWEELSKNADRSKLLKVPVLIYKRRGELLDYLGFRHISGVKEWKAEAKARYLWQLITSENIDFARAARRVGSTAPAVRRQVEAYCVLNQGVRNRISVEPAQRWFGLFYNALQDPGVRRYLALPEKGELQKPKKNPIPPTRLGRLENVVYWLFGDDDRRRRVVRESRRIRDLGKVLLNPGAVKVLLDSEDLDLALKVAGSDREGIETALVQARVHLLAANGEAFRWKGDKRIITLAKEVEKVFAQALKNLNASRSSR
jgi:hypothetical protein